MFKHLISASFILGMAVATPPAMAGQHQSQNCGARDVITAKLIKSFGEQHRASGLEDSARLIEFWTSDETGSWTVLITSPDGTSCIAASGRAWIDYPEGKPLMGVVG